MNKTAALKDSNENAPNYGTLGMESEKKYFEIF